MLAEMVAQWCKIMEIGKRQRLWQDDLLGMKMPQTIDSWIVKTLVLKQNTGTKLILQRGYDKKLSSRESYGG